MESFLGIFARCIVEFLAAMITEFSPFRIIRKIFFDTPLLEDPDSALKLLVVWFFDCISWVIIILFSVLLFHAVFSIGG